MISAYDADTVTLDVDLGFGVRYKIVVRLYRIDAWEMRGTERLLGLQAKNWLLSVMPVGSKVFIETYKDKKGKYGRYLADIYPCIDGEYLCANDELVRLGHAEYHDY